MWYFDIFFLNADFFGKYRSSIKLSEAKDVDEVQGRRSPTDQQYPIICTLVLPKAAALIISSNGPTPRLCTKARTDQRQRMTSWVDVSLAHRHIWEPIQFLVNDDWNN